MNDAVTELLSALTESRRAHSIAVGQRMEGVAALLPTELRADAITAAYLHDVGYGHPDTGFHPIDGARLLRSQGYSHVVCHMVAFHTAAEVEAEVRGLSRKLLDDFASGTYPDSTRRTTSCGGPTSQPDRTASHSPSTRDSRKSWSDTSRDLSFTPPSRRLLHN